MDREFTRRAGGEYYASQERIGGAQAFLEDNRSDEANRRRALWNESRRLRRQILTVTCSDSRIVLLDPTNEIALRAVASGISPDEFTAALTNPNIAAINLMGHHAGSEMLRGEPPSGCGGMAVKKDLVLGKTPRGDIEQWVAERVHAGDLLIHLFRLAQKVLEKTGSSKEVLMSTQDHLDKTVYPLYAFRHNPVAPISIDFEHFIPEEVYTKGVPHLTDEQLEGSVFAGYLRDYYKDRFPTFHSWALTDRFSQVSQNPRILLITSNIRPAQVCYPNLSERPGDMFVVTVGREKPASGNVEIPETSVRSAVCQAEYPIAHFSRTKTILVETGNIEQSRRIANRIASRDWSRSWLSRNGSQIFLGQTRGGRLERIAPFEAARR